MKKVLVAAGMALVLVACSGADSVVTVNGIGYDVDDVPIETELSTIDLDTFRNALNWVIRDQVVTAAARDEFGISLDRDELEVRAADALEGLSPEDRLDPRANLDYFLIQARVGRNGLVWEQIQPLLPEGVGQNQWAIEQLRVAEVEVDARYGEWRTDPEPLVYGP